MRMRGMIMIPSNNDYVYSCTNAYIIVLFALLGVLILAAFTL